MSWEPNFSLLLTFDIHHWSYINLKIIKNSLNLFFLNSGFTSIFFEGKEHWKQIIFIRRLNTIFAVWIHSLHFCKTCSIWEKCKQLMIHPDITNLRSNFCFLRFAIKKTVLFGGQIWNILPKSFISKAPMFIWYPLSSALSQQTLQSWNLAV